MRIVLASLLIICSSSAFGQAQLILDVFPPTCEGCCDGAVNVSIDGCLVPEFTFEWYYQSAAFSFAQNITDICDAGVWAVSVIDESANQLDVTFDIVIGEVPYTITENFAIDCVSGGGTLIDCFLFPPTDSLSNGEACVVPPECWVEPVSYTWFDENQNVIGTSDCITGLFSGNYTVIIIGDEGEDFSFEVNLFDGAPLELISQDACPPNGISEFDYMGFHLFPNPAVDHIQLSIDDAYAGLTYRVADLQGREVMEGQLNSLSTTIDLSILSAGTYVITLLGEVGEVMGVERLLRE